MKALDAISSIKKNYSSLSEVERRLADFILKDPEGIVNRTMQSLSSNAQVSSGTVINFCNKVGFPGYTKLKIDIAKNLSAQQDVWKLDDLTPGDTPRAVMGRIIANATGSFQDTLRCMTEQDLEQAAEAILRAERIEVYGVGSSSMVATDVSYRLMRLGISASAVTDALLCVVSASLLNERCLAIGISHSGRTQATLRAVRAAADTGARTICLTSFAQSPLTQLCDIPLVITSKESGEHREAVVSRLTQLVVVDSLCAYIGLQQPLRSLETMEHISDIYEEYR